MGLWGYVNTYQHKGGKPLKPVLNERLRANCLPWRRAVALGVLGAFYLFRLLALQQHDVTVFQLSIIIILFIFSAAIS